MKGLATERCPVRQCCLRLSWRIGARTIKKQRC